MSKNATPTPATTRIAMCYQPGNTTARRALDVRRDNHKNARLATRRFTVAEIDNGVGTGFVTTHPTEADAIAYAASLGYSEVHRIEISDELTAGIQRYADRIAALGGYGTRIRATTPDGVTHEGVLIERGYGGCQPGLQDDGQRYAINLDTTCKIGD